jgi:hypothetical protein
MTSGDDSLRLPTSLDHAGILRRLVSIRDSARAAGLLNLANLLTDLDTKNTRQLGGAVVSAISMVQEKPEFDAIAQQLSLVALNLKNLK